MTSCPHCAQSFEPAPSADAVCPACGRPLDGTTGDAPTTQEVDLAGARVVVTPCPRCKTDLITSEADLAGVRFGKCSACGFVFVLADEALDRVGLDDPRVPGAGTLTPFRGQEPAEEARSAEEITGASTNVDSGIKRESIPPPAVLIAEKPPMRVTLTRDVTVIGRVKADVVIDQADVSRRHVEITRKGGVYVVRDLGSTNGTYLNGQRIEEAPLSGGDRLVVGQTVFHVQIAAEGEGIYLLLAMAPVGAAAQSAESQKLCLQAYEAALAEAFAGQEKDVLSSAQTGRALAIFPFDDDLSGAARRALARTVLAYPEVFHRHLGAEGGQQGHARVAIALGAAKRVVQGGRSKLTGEIISRIANLFSAPEPPGVGAVIEDASLHRLLAPEPDEELAQVMGRLGYELAAAGGPELHALSYHASRAAAQGAATTDAAAAHAAAADELEELCAKARVGIEAELAAAFGAGGRAGSKNPKLAARLAKTDAEVRLRTALYQGLTPTPIFITQPLVIQWLKHLDDGGRMLEKFQPIRALFGEDDLRVVSLALRLLCAAYHGLTDLKDLTLRQIAKAASSYLRSAEPAGASDPAHLLNRVLMVYADARDQPRDASDPVHLFEFLTLLALIRALRTRGGVSDLLKAKALLESLKGYETVWNQMLRDEAPTAAG